MTRPAGTVQQWATDATFTSGPESGNPVKTDPLANAAQGQVPGSPVQSEHLNFLKNNHGVFGAWLWQELTNAIDDTTAGTADNFLRDLLRESGLSHFGDGSDGNATITGGTTFLSRDMYYDDLTVESTGILETNGFRVFVRGTCQIDAGGIITAAGGDGQDGGAGGAGGSTGGSSGSVTPGTGGGSGSTGAGGTSTAQADSLGGQGGNGGAGQSGSGGAAGTVTAPAAFDGGYRHVGNHLGFIQDRIGTQITYLTPGSGGGGGGGDGASDSGGGGGGGGGVLPLYAYALNNEGTITVAGGDGGDGAGPLTPGGGGGGGGGGVLLLGYRRLGTTGLGTRSVAGGAGGLAGGGAAAAGSPGADGLELLFRL